MKLQLTTLSLSLIALVAADTATIHVYSDSNCQNLIESANLGNTEVCHTVTGGQTYHSAKTLNVGQGLFGRNINLQLISSQCGGTGDVKFEDVPLTNNANCHVFTGKAFGLKQL
ncbi:hypothetical protein BT63DRAFT_425893 [Microthyrium microscopicum]|uniref:Cyanovirin-N domain-containing protein n=1 Tax=Microthyrium microscopicum TaxID=703497 RepID=A0A6A6U9F4_9PEZI|nr:hypothetical protein BT63DRAFT_425893 [Microthyrium microscopicum]